ncbi:dynamin family protein [Aliterella atlantica]|uniref:Dynamin family protein n=1 Tax=Aliterella atlantica CENA595 TaxID=1618023 RepID=A0A0D8ZV61_9CYAN|nr:dynamin family protein [Aliterella atlantica]KJH72252.1 dynamin family protein [Aliterella atlantica CENA595]
MNTVLIGTEAVDLLSRITGQKLSQRDITPPVVFLATLVTILSGVIYVDGVVTNEEKQRLHSTLNRFSLANSSLGQLTQLMLKGVAKEQIYKKLGELTPLIALLSPSQRLLLVGFGYEMSAADGDIDIREQKYLQIVANRLEIAPRHLAVIEASFSGQGDFEKEALAEVQSLLDSARFHDLDAVFIKAASDLVAVLPTIVEPTVTQKQNFSTYEQLAEFQKHRQQIDGLCFEIYKIVKDCADSDFLPSTLEKEVKTISNKLQSQRFRVAVIGEFSQGKSTLLNALLGQEIQPVRAVPCSGTITILRYGKQKRIICRYKDGREEEISHEEYKDKASISKQAALDGLSEELRSSEIDEIIFESPDLSLCQNGVEILDSPGLNEHPQRTAITQKLLKETDAAIFLTNAMRLLPEKEKDLLRDVKSQLVDGQENEPADNLFILVNFMDLLDDEEDKIDIKQRLNSFINGKNLLIKGEKRIHYISAKAALKSHLNGTEDEYLQAFHNFTNHLEQFLISEQGDIKINDATRNIHKSIESCVNGLDRAVEILEGKLKISEQEKQQILEQIGEVSGRDVKIRLLVNTLLDNVYEQANASWQEWLEGLDERLVKRSEQWSSPHSPIWSRNELAKDYARQFNQDLSTELDLWINNQLKESVLKESLEILDNVIQQELQAIQSNFQNISYLLNKDSINMQFLQESQVNFSSEATKGFWGGFGVLGFGAAILPVILFTGPIMAIILGMGAGTWGMIGITALEESIKNNVFQMGGEQFANSLDDILEKINQVINSLFIERLESVSQVIEQTILISENLLEQQNNVHQATLEQRNVEKIWIEQKRKELKKLQLELKKTIG